jgi:hypothetical protein
MKSRVLSVLLVGFAFATASIAEPPREGKPERQRVRHGAKAARAGERVALAPRMEKHLRQKARDRRASRLRARAAAPGARPASASPLGTTLFSESFDTGIPAGWTVVDNVGSGVEWSSIAGCGEKGNFTNGTGEAACVSSDVFGIANYDTELRTPSLDLSASGAPMSLAFTANYIYLGKKLRSSRLGGTPTPQAFEVDYSTAGGSGPWTNLLSWEEDHGDFRTIGAGEDVVLDIGAVAGQANVVFRFRYKNVPEKGFAFDWYAQVDDLEVIGTPVGCSLTCPANITVGNSPGLCSATVAFDPPTTSGPCAPVVCTPPAGSSFLVGTTPVNCVEQQQLGVGASCSFSVTVNDTEPPVITCPADQEATIPDGSTEVTVFYPPVPASDNCTNPISASCVPPTGTSFPEGTHPVSCSATDTASNSANCGFNVIAEAGGGGSVLEIPSLSGLGLGALAGLLALAGFLALRRGH